MAKALSHEAQLVSTTLVITTAAGTISHGKYIFVSRLALLIRLSEQLLSAVQNNYQGRNPANTTNVQGASP